MKLIKGKSRVRIIASLPAQGQCSIGECIGKTAVFRGHNEDGSIQVSIRGLSFSPCALQPGEWEAVKPKP